jgi:Sulfotransferase family
MPLTQTQQSISDFSALAESKKWTTRNELLVEMESLYSSIGCTSQEGVVLCFALAKIYDDLGEVDACFALLCEGNEQHKKGKTDTVDDARSTISTVKEIFSGQPISPLQSSSDYQPIFIVGMPRSGTSLVEQILASHADVYGAGELKYIGQWCFGYVNLFKKCPDKKLQNYLAELQNHYLKGLNALTTKQYVTDKMPVNFLWLGFILSAFPDAKIVHTMRSPMATCWSIYKSPFAGASNGYSCSQEDVAEFYNLYTDLMDFWRSVFPDKIYDLHYEQLTIDQTEETRTLLSYCGLDWDPNCLQFHKNRRRVDTLSAAQVQLPMYQGSSEAWKRFEKHLSPMKAILKEY